MEKQGVPMQQYPHSPDTTGQPPVYHQDAQSPHAADPVAQHAADPAAQHAAQQQMYAQQQQQQQQQYAGAPAPQDAYSQAAAKHAHAQLQPGMPPQQPGMPPQQPSGTVYQNATPIASLNRGPAPADCPACGQRAMTNIAFETGNTTHAWALGVCCLCLLGCIPYLMNSLKDVTHKCGCCGVLLATWHRSGTTEVHIHS